MASGPVRRPLSAFALSLASGILVVVASLLLLLTFFFPFLFALLGLAFGTIILFSSVLMYARPREHAIWGILILVFACLSIVGFGGFVAGMILGIIGGSLGIAWRPEGQAFRAYAPMPAYAPYGYPPMMGAYGGAPMIGAYGGTPMMGAQGVPVTPWRMCMGCGRWIPWTDNVCPLCGTQAPVAGWIPRAEQAPLAGASANPAAFAPPVAPPVFPMAPPVPAYRAPAPSPPPVKAPCPTCTGEAEWYPSRGRWYCPAESKYF